MAGATTNFGYVKPAEGENYDLTILNKNFDDIDRDINGRLSANAPFGHMGRTGGFQAIGGNDVGVVMAGAQRLVGGMTFEAASAGRLVVPIAGRYMINVCVYATTGSGYRAAGAAYFNSVKIPGTEAILWKADGNDYVAFAMCEVILSAGDKVGMGMSTTGSTAGTTGWNGSFIELRWMGPT